VGCGGGQTAHGDHRQVVGEDVVFPKFAQHLIHAV